MLYPRGVKSVHEVPWPLQDGINHALSVISWHENHLPEEIPDENLWEDAEAVEIHFKAVAMRKEAQRDGYRVSDDPGDSDMTTNDLASVFRQ